MVIIIVSGTPRVFRMTLLWIKDGEYWALIIIVFLYENPWWQDANDCCWGSWCEGFRVLVTCYPEMHLERSQGFILPLVPTCSEPLLEQIDLLPRATVTCLLFPFGHTWNWTNTNKPPKCNWYSFKVKVTCNDASEHIAWNCSFRITVPHMIAFDRKGSSRDIQTCLLFYIKKNFHCMSMFFCNKKSGQMKWAKIARSFQVLLSKKWARICGWMERLCWQH